MGLRQRVILIITIPALLATAVHGAIRAREETAQVVTEAQQDLALIATAIQIAVENALRDRQLSDVQRLVSEMVEQQKTIDRIRLFDNALTQTFVSNPLKFAEAVPVEALTRVVTYGVPEGLYERRDQQPLVSFLAPIRGLSGGVEGAMEIVRVATDVDRRTQAVVFDVLIRLGILLTAIIVLTAVALQRQVLRPLALLAEGIQRLGRGEAGAPLPVDRTDELGKVAQQFNEMTERLQEAQRRLLAETERALQLEHQARQAGTLAVAGKLAAGLAHEVGTPLNIISGRTEFILRSVPPDDPRREDLEAIVAQIDRISRIITGLLDAVRPQVPKLQAIAVAPLADDLFPLLRHVARQRGVSLMRAVPEDLPRIMGDGGQLQQVLINLVVNALEATPSGGKVTIAARTEARRDRPGVAVSVTDSGSGIAPELVPKIFDSFFTTKPRGQGTGLGLSICRDIVRAHAGEIAVESQPGTGATFTVWVPSAGAAA